MPHRTRTASRCLLGLPGAVSVVCACVATAAPPQAGTSELAAADAAPPATGAMMFDDEVVLDNGRVYLGVSPGVGRVVSFGPSSPADAASRTDLIWTAAADAADHATPGVAVPDQRYINFGGDKLWVAPQVNWGRATGNDGWPPEGVIDGEAWQITQQSDTSLTLQSRPSPHYHVVAVRRFELADDRPAVHITNTIHRTRPNPFPVQAWTITQVRLPRQVVMDIADPRPLDQTHRPLTADTPEKTDGDLQLIDGDAALVWSIGPQDDAKVGTFGNWIAAVYDHHSFLQRTNLDPDAAYPDASNLQTYRGVGYVELETLGPAVQLAEGQTIRTVVEWQLLTHDDGPPEPAALVEQQD